MRQTVQIDFGVGDAVHPEPQVIDYCDLDESPGAAERVSGGVGDR